MNDNLNSIFNPNELKEDQTHEFKTSIFVSPESQLPGQKQMHVIAETLAAFMNAEGGQLIIGRGYRRASFYGRSGEGG